MGILGDIVSAPLKLASSVIPSTTKDPIGQEHTERILGNAPIAQGSLQAFLAGQQMGRMAPHVSEAGGAPALIRPRMPAPPPGAASGGNPQQALLDQIGRSSFGGMLGIPAPPKPLPNQGSINAALQSNQGLLNQQSSNPFVGFATGGSFPVTGFGGQDSQTVAFKATPGERVTIQPPPRPAPTGFGGQGINGAGIPQAPVPQAPQSRPQAPAQAPQTGGGFQGTNNIPTLRPTHFPSQPAPAPAPRPSPHPASTLPDSMFAQRPDTLTPGGQLGAQANPNARTGQPTQQFFDGSEDFRSRQMTLADMLQGQADGSAPSLADQQFRNAKDQLARQQLAFAAGNRGNAAGAARQAQQQIGTLGAQLAGQSAAARLDERQRAQGQLGNLLGTGRSGDQRTALANLDADLRQQQINLGALGQLQAGENARLQALLGQPVQQSDFGNLASLAVGGLGAAGAAGLFGE